MQEIGPLDWLVLARAIHFLACIVVAGAALFSILVAEPFWGEGQVSEELLGVHRRHLELMLIFGLAFATASGLAYFLLVAQAVADASMEELSTNGTLWALAVDTQFGRISLFRFALAIALAALLLTANWGATPPQRAKRRILGASIATIILGSLAWTGHAASATGLGADLHLLSDLVHTLTAGAWLGGLFPLALAVSTVRPSSTTLIQDCHRVLRRFSRLGIVCVCALAVTGIVNAWYLTNHLRDLLGTDYGGLVLGKSTAFVAMLCLAAVNRLRLMPALQNADAVDLPTRERVLRLLLLTIMLEIALGLVVIYLVGALGMTPPSGHVH